ncbi:AI-2E family transporter [Roseicitreum antarcticum]|uniref:Predicted PurR-regulated permease PerM n=1 Tax=Roseicitreum antarcticum TaxID=564137 RepID=A0A1H2ZBQ5_9RHOB|nr:AI-2E family transporter [Roseicitreum antarcticum]SDX14775.1 Predicted PurR-regulated permease PerM [Roseicitreum antarcticum]
MAQIRPETAYAMRPARKIRASWVAQATFWLAICLLTLGALWMLSGIVTPFFIGVLMAYFLNPTVTWLAARRVPRPVAAAGLLFLMLGALVAGLALIVPTLLNQLYDLFEALPDIFAQFKSWIGEGTPRFVNSDADDVREMLSDAADAVSENRDQVLSGLSMGLSGLSRLVLFWVVMPVVAFYLLVDWPRLTTTVYDAIPRHHLNTICKLLADMDDVLSGFVRGQSVVCLLLAGFYAVALLLAGLNYGLAVGVVTGLISFIPYVGAFVGGALAIGLAVYQFWDAPQLIGAVVAIYAFGQVLEGQILVPRLVGNSIRLHPVWLIFAVLAFGSLFGFVGALLSVPLAAVLGVLSRFVYTRYRHSAFYGAQSEGSGTTTSAKPDPNL